MITAAALSLWLSAETQERVNALADLVEAGDLNIVAGDSNDLFGLSRGHTDIVTRFETGTALPAMATAIS